MALACPHCKGPRTLADKVCSKCRFHFETGKVIELMPPRAGDRERVLRDPAGAQARRAWERIGTRQWMVFATIGVAPGMGHVASGERRRGLFFAAATLMLYALSARFFGYTLARGLFGIAIALHAYSIFELTPLRRVPNPLARIFGVLLIQLSLLIALWPVVRWLSLLMIPPLTTGDIGERGAHVRVSDNLMDGITGGFVFAIIIAVFSLTALVRYARKRGDDFEEEPRESDEP